MLETASFTCHSTVISRKMAALTWRGHLAFNIRHLVRPLSLEPLLAKEFRNNSIKNVALKHFKLFWK